MPSALPPIVPPAGAEKEANPPNRPAPRHHAPQHRAEPRVVPLIRAAKLATPSGEYLCVIRDISSGGISLRLLHEVPDCARSIIELQNGDRYPVSLVWKQDQRAGFRFLDQADVARIIEPPSRFPKRPLRIRIQARAQLMAGLRRLEVGVLDLSQHGARISCAAPLTPYQKVQLALPALRPLAAQLRWQRDGEAGLAFRHPLGFEELALLVRDLNRQGEDFHRPAAAD